MHSARLTAHNFSKIVSTLFLFTAHFSSQAQENSPLSRYGIGDLNTAQNISSRGMGGVATGVVDFNAVNLKNPAALSSVRNTTFDIGFDITSRSLSSTTNSDKFTNVNTNFSYFQLAVPLASPKMLRKSMNWGLAFGVRPVSNINYKLNRDGVVARIDTSLSLYRGTGGLNQANISTGFSIKNLSLGLSTGYMFGNKDVSSNLNIYSNDSAYYYNSESAQATHFGGVFFTAGLQYRIDLKNKSSLTIGASSTLKNNLRGSGSVLHRTVFTDDAGALVSIDTVAYNSNLKGDVTLPMQSSIGFSYADSLNTWIIGADVDFSNWKDYRYFGNADFTRNTTVYRFGAQYHPITRNLTSRNYWTAVKYRFGGYYGQDYLNINNEARNIYGVSLGAGLPLTSLKKRRSLYDDFGLLNAGVEFGARGNNSSFSLKEKTVRVSLGVAINSTWFIKRRYN